MRITTPRSRSDSPVSTIESKKKFSDQMSVSSHREKHIQVCVRVRPLNAREIDLQGEDSVAWLLEDNEIIQKSASYEGGSHNSKLASFKFDHLFCPGTETEEIYHKAVKSVVLNTMEGYHGSVLTYGQTSTGKTFTMQGSPGSPGLIELAVNQCFDYVRTGSDDKEYLFKVSYFEIYNEQMKDLLSLSNTNLKIINDKKNDVSVVGAKEEVVVDPQQVLSLVAAGESQRHVGATNANLTSSRSHTIFRMTIESRDRTATEYGSISCRRVSTLSLVDLAGSESIKISNATGERQKEGSFINRSLLTLGHIIFKLTEENKVMKGEGMGGLSSKHLPYRDSKLTRLLQPSLGGNAQVAIVCTISPSITNIDETKNTLMFASRAKKVKNLVKVNEVMDQDALLRRYRMEVSKLRLQLKEAQEMSRLTRSQSFNSTSRRQSVAFGDLSVNDDFESFEEDFRLRNSRDDEVEQELQNAILQVERIILNSQLQLPDKTPSSTESVSTSGTPSLKAIKGIYHGPDGSFNSGTMGESESPAETPRNGELPSRKVSQELDFSSHRMAELEKKYEFGMDLQRLYSTLSGTLERVSRRKAYNTCSSQIIENIDEEPPVEAETKREDSMQDAVNRQDLADCIDMLEKMNEAKKDLELKNAQLEAETKRLVKILESRESELLVLKGIQPDEEVF